MLKLTDDRLLRTHAYIDGKWLPGDDGRIFPVINPADGRQIAEVAAVSVEQTRLAIQAAERALGPWRALTAKERGAVLKRWFSLVMEAREDLAAIMTAEQGKPLAEATGEIVYGAAFIEWFAEEAKRVYGDVIPEHMPGRRIIVTKEPVGVVAAITPWNFPSAMITRKCAPALAVGCTVVIKPAEDTPLSALALAELADRAGLPPGVFNVVTADDPVAVGAEMTSNPIVRKISFTGSTEVGRHLMRASAQTVKKVSLELGGNAPFIVFDDADLDEAVKGAIVCKFRNSGQTCVCANRILVQDRVYEEFAARLAERASALKVGPGADPGVQQGPLINHAALEKVERIIDDAVTKGARVLTGGRAHPLGGLFFEPTVLADTTPEMACAREEVFGPMAPLFRFKTEEEAIQLANDTEYGLAAYFYARDIGRVWRVSRALDYGIIGINEGIISTEVAPFGGMKQSGLGREGSKYGIEEFLEIKYLCMGGI